MTRLSVNINKVALLRNARLGNFPDLFLFAKKCEEYGAHGITVHPRPDERHIRYSDIPILKKIVQTEFNIEGNPGKKFMDLILEVQPDQCTLVPDKPDVLTSDSGWDTVKEQGLLVEVIQALKQKGIRASVFVNPIPKMIEGAAKAGADRIEIYTGDFAKQFPTNSEEAVQAHKAASKIAQSIGLGVNAGHDLNLENLSYYNKEVQNIKEVSIGHAIIADTLYYGIQNTIQLYLRALSQ
jgi:pyridoxine 5-phosphate synthase